MKYLFAKGISTILAAVFILSLLPGNIVFADTVFNTDEIAEIEKGVFVQNRVLFEKSDAASGTVYCKTTGAAIAKPEKITRSDFNLIFNIEESGNYSTYIRVYFSSELQDKFYYSWNFNGWKMSEQGETGGKFKWVKLEDCFFEKGRQKLSIVRGETGGCFDAVYVCKDDMMPPEKIDGVSEENVEADAGVVSQQKEIPAVDGVLQYEFEDMTFCTPFVVASDRGASGQKLIKNTKAKSPDRDTLPSPSNPGTVRFRYKAARDGMYYVYARIRCSTDNRNTFTHGYNDGIFIYHWYEGSPDFRWVSLGSRKLSAGDIDTLKIHHRKNGVEFDKLLINTTGIKPVGREGIVEDSVSSANLILKSDRKKPEITPPANQHPRVLFRKEDIERIKKNIDEPQNKGAKDYFENYLSSETDGSVSGYSEKTLMAIEAWAFDYAVNNNLDNGKKAVKAIKNYLETVNLRDSTTDDRTRNGGKIVFVASEVYDWCYDLIGLKEKAELIKLCAEIARNMEIGWPPGDMGTVIGHGSEAQFLKVMLSFAIATYDERPDIWNKIGAYFYEEYVPVREWANKAHINHQGANYGPVRHQWDTWAYLLITGMGAPEPYNGTDLANVAYSLIYARRPDGQYFREGDNWLDSRAKMWSYWNEFAQIYSHDGAITDDPYLKYEFFKQNPGLTTFQESSSISHLIFNNPQTEAKTPDDLPLSRYFGSPVGLTVARTGWSDGVESPDAIAYMKVGEYRFENHQHNDSGSFQLYYKGILASRSGVYQGLEASKSDNGGTSYGSVHFNKYASQSIAYNTMLIADETGDGLQKNLGEPGSFADMMKPEHNVSQVKGEEIDPKNPQKPHYTYLKGDISKAYDENKLESFDRSFMFLNLFNDKVPAALIVYDRVNTPNSGLKKTWLLHTQEEPAIDGAKVTVKRTIGSQSLNMGYNGKLTVDNLLPQNSDISIVGSEETGWSNVNGVDYPGYPSALKTSEGNSYRVEISPSAASKLDYFLNVLQVSDADEENYIPTEKIVADEFYGVKIADRVVLFGKNRDRVDSGFELETYGSDNYEYTICDVAAGVWEVTVGDENQRVEVSEKGGVLAFTAKGGKISIKPVTDGNAGAITAEPIKKADGREIRVRINDVFVYSSKRPTIVRNVLMLPISLFERYYGLTSVTDGGVTTVQNEKGTVLMTVDENSKLVSVGEKSEVYEVYRDGGELMVPARAVAESFGGTISWDALTDTAFITTPPVDYSKPEGYAEIIEVIADDGPADGENVAAKMIDENVSTRWSANGKGRYVDFVLDKNTKICNAEIVFHQNNGRNAEFEIQVSEDGKKFVTVYKGMGDGSVESGTWEKFDFKPVSVRYIRYIGNGSKLNAWNSVIEIRFKEETK